MQPDPGRLRRSREPFLKRRLVRLQLSHARLHRQLVQAILDGPDHACDLAAHGFEPSFVLGPVLGLLGRHAVHLVVERAGKLLDQLGCQEPMLEAVEHSALQFVAPDPAVVVTSPLGAMGGAAVIVRVDDREPPAAHAACEQAAQHVFLPVRAVQRVAVGITAHDNSNLSLAGLDRLPQCVVDDAQFGYRHDLPLPTRVRPGDALAGARVLDVGAAVPLQAPDVERVVEDARPPIELTADGGVPPVAPVRPRHAFNIEPLCDRAGTRAGREQREDALDHRRLGGVDPALAGAVRGRRQDVVTIRLATRNLALQRTTQLPPLGLLSEVFEEHLRHGAEHADMHGRDLTGRHRVQPDAQEAQPVMQVGHIRELAAEPIQGFDEDQIKSAALGVHLHLLER